MKGIDLLPLAQENKDRLKKFALEYRKYARIEIEIFRFDEAKKRVMVRAEQKILVNDRFLKKTELTERVRDMFAGEIPDDWRVTVSAVNYDRKDISSIDNIWLKDKMQLHGLKSKDIVNHMGYDKTTVSSFLSGVKPLSQTTKAAFYYFFKYYELAKFDDGK